MGLDDIVRSAVGIAKSVTLDLQDDVTIQRWIRDIDDYGTPDYAPAVVVKAIVLRIQKVVKKFDGTESIATTYLAILEQLTPQGASGRREPLDERDKITMSDGTFGQVLNMSGLMDAQTHAPYYLEVYLG